MVIGNRATPPSALALFLRNNQPPCIYPKELDAELILSGVFDDIYVSDDPALAMFKSPAKEVQPLDQKKKSLVPDPGDFAFSKPFAAPTRPAHIDCEITAARLLKALLTCI